MKFHLIFCCLSVLSLCACGTLQVGVGITPEASHSLSAAPTPGVTETSQGVASPENCASGFQHRELNEPFQQDNAAFMPRYTLSTEELDTHLAAMGIDELCIPSTLGAPFINTDWNSDASTALSGRMISLGFENLFNGAGWSRGFILYATYDFAAGTEYETFATREDLEALQRGAMEDLIEVDGFHGFIRIQQSYFCMGTCTAYKVFVFPFESHYLAVAYDFGAFLAEADWESVFQDLKEGRYPAESQNEMAEMEQLVSGIQFVH